MSRLLLCTDLDRTLLPNGAEPESGNARQRFNQLAGHPQVTLVYVTGRHRELVEQAIAQYQVPRADYVIANVGSTIYRLTDVDWVPDDAWEQAIRGDWQGKSSNEIGALLQDIDGLQLQEPEKQNTFKLSYYVRLDVDHHRLIGSAKKILSQHALACNLVWSIDQQARIGLLDILPASAGKRQAIEFLIEQLGFEHGNTVFAGDSGNDVCVLSSPIKSVLVANAENGVRAEAVQQARENQQQDALYLAKGDYLGMNGNYAAGILEGVAHFMPAAEHWFASES